jgi:hypothetical protein
VKKGIKKYRDEIAMLINNTLFRPKISDSRANPVSVTPDANVPIVKYDPMRMGENPEIDK